MVWHPPLCRRACSRSRSCWPQGCPARTWRPMRRPCSHLQATLTTSRACTRAGTQPAQGACAVRPRQSRAARPQQMHGSPHQHASGPCASVVLPARPPCCRVGWRGMRGHRRGHPSHPADVGRPGLQRHPALRHWCGACSWPRAIHVRSMPSARLQPCTRRGAAVGAGLLCGCAMHPTRPSVARTAPCLPARSQPHRAVLAEAGRQPAQGHPA
jgi:hypothetical protein